MLAAMARMMPSMKWAISMAPLFNDVGAFDYYCILFDTGKDVHGEIDAFAMSYNAFTEVLLASYSLWCCLPLGLDLVWTTVNALTDALIASSTASIISVPCAPMSF